MKGYPCPYLSTIQGEFLEPQPSSKPTVASGFELHPGYIALVWEQPFSGAKDEDPYNHLQEFEELCSCLVIQGIKQETLRWKLFPFSLTERAEQWYIHNVGNMSSDWERLQDDFYRSFPPLSFTPSPWSDILAFEQSDKESLGAAWVLMPIISHFARQLLGNK
jgi:hypothetical protein